MPCPRCGYEFPRSGSGKSIKSKLASQFKEPAAWLEARRAEHGDGDGFFAAIRHDTGINRFPLGERNPAYKGLNLNDVPDEWYVKFYCSKGGSDSMKDGDRFAGWSHLWYYTLAVLKLDPNEFAGKHNLRLGFPGQKLAPK